MDGGTLKFIWDLRFEIWDTEIELFIEPFVFAKFSFGKITNRQWNDKIHPRFEIWDTKTGFNHLSFGFAKLSFGKTTNRQ